MLDLVSRAATELTIKTVEARSTAQDGQALENCLEQAEAYNASLGHYEGPAVGELLPYGEQLRTGDDEVMAWVEVPKAGIRLAVYHGTSPEALASGAGHLEGTSLPVGGSSSHCVLTAHSGMAESGGFDEVRRLGEGDLFFVHTLGRTYAYRVSQVEVVLPDDVSNLGIQQGRDLCTLVTCTPYGVNDHRLLVHGERTEVPAEEAAQAEPLSLVNGRSVPALVATLAGVPMLAGRLARRGGAHLRHHTRWGRRGAGRSWRPQGKESGETCVLGASGGRGAGRHFSLR